MRGLFVFVAAALVACGSDVTVEGGSGGAAAAGGGATSSSSSSGPGSGSGTGGTGVGGSAGATGSGGGGGIDCNPTRVACDGPVPYCPPGEVPEVVAGCWGNCVPILSCASEPNCDNCEGGFCAEYVAFVTEYRCVMPSLMCSSLACGCLAPYFCISPYDACSETPSGGLVSCGCPTC